MFEWVVEYSEPPAVVPSLLVDELVEQVVVDPLSYDPEVPSEFLFVSRESFPIPPFDALVLLKAYLHQPYPHRFSGHPYSPNPSCLFQQQGQALHHL